MLLLVALLLGAAYLFHLYSKRQRRQKELHSVVEKRDCERSESFAKAETSCAKLNPAKRDRIAAWDFKELRENLLKGNVTCLEVLRTYQYKALLAHAKTTCVTALQLRYRLEAERWAAEWDEKATASNFVKPPFFGIPISLKECIPVRRNSRLRTGRREAIENPIRCSFNKLSSWTNVPQSLLSYEPAASYLTVERITTGQTANHPGGIPQRVKCVLPPDVSLSNWRRTMPSHLRFSHRGNPGAVPGRPLINANEGPMAKDIRTSVEFLRE
ncbi:hypothetical protein COOONC_05083, partial [Cooperia oncophora]